MHPVADGVACTLENGLITSTDTISLSEVESLATRQKESKEELSFEANELMESSS